MLPEKMIEDFVAWSRTAIQANSDNIEAEMAENEKGVAKVSLILTLTKAGKDILAKVRCRVPRSAAVEEDTLTPRQANLPGV